MLRSLTLVLLFGTIANAQQTFIGTIYSTDLRKGIVILEANKRYLTLSVNKNTKATLDGKDTILEELLPMMPATCTYTRVNFCLSIKASSPPKPVVREAPKPPAFEPKLVADGGLEISVFNVAVTNDSERYLAIVLNLHNPAEKKRVDVESLALSLSKATLLDDAENKYKFHATGIQFDGRFVQKGSINPGKSAFGRINAEVPIEKADFLILSFPSTDADGKRIRFKIPKEAWNK